MKAILVDFLSLLEKYHGGNFGSGLCSLSWLHLSMNKKFLSGVLDNLASLNFYGLRNAGKQKFINLLTSKVKFIQLILFYYK